MRRAAPLILLGFVAILYGVGRTYYVRLKEQAANTPVKPRKLAPGQTATFHGWTYSLEDGLLCDLKMCVASPAEVTSSYQNALENPR